MKTLNYKNGIIKLSSTARNTQFNEYTGDQIKKVEDTSEMVILKEGSLKGVDFAFIEITNCYTNTEYSVQRNIFFYRKNVADGMISKGFEYEIGMISESKYNDYITKLA